MRQLLLNLRRIWQQQLSFKLAALYLLLVAVTAFILPLLPIAYLPNELDLQHTFAKPFAGASAHWLGTDALGRDVLSNILYGARTAFAISIPVMLLSTVLGLGLGLAAGYFGDSGLKTSRGNLVVSVLASFGTLYYAVYLPLNLVALKLPAHSIGLSILLLLLLLFVLYKVVRPLLKKWAFGARPVSVPVDYLVLRFAEAFTSVPRLLLILALASFLQPSMLLLSVIFILTFWPSAARLARAEMLKIKALPYFEAAKSIGATSGQLLFRHALPNMLGPIVVTFTFGLAGLLVLESVLSFLGIGVLGTFASWGRTIAGIRANTAAWWLVFFPGLALAATVWALQTVSFHLLNYLESRKQS